MESSNEERNDDNETLKELHNIDQEFKDCENFIFKFENGQAETNSKVKLKEYRERLKKLMEEVRAREMFSKNEHFDELPTGSLKFLLVPAYLGAVIQNIHDDSISRVELLDEAKVYFRGFLESLQYYEIISFELPWKTDSSDIEDDSDVKRKAKFDRYQARTDKIKRFEYQKTFENQISTLQKCTDNGMMDETLRNIYLARIRLYALKALSDLESIDDERPLAEHMLKVRAGVAKPLSTKKADDTTNRFRPTLIITRNLEQKKVFGLGYPSVPTLTVDEWYSSMEREGRFAIPSLKKQKKAEDSESDEDSDEERKKAQKWDDYKDYHRRGWGNTFNKG